MTISIRTPLALALALWLLASLPLFAQVTDAKPIRIRQEAPKPRIEKFLGEVLHMTPVAITVRDRQNKNLVRTFTYDEKLAPKMAALLRNNRPFQHGDRVEIRFLAGSDTAVKIKGKPSPPRGGLR